MISRIILLTLLSTTFVFGAACSTIPAHPKGYETYVSKGDDFKDTQLTDIEGNPVIFSDNKKKLIILFATWCSDSKRTLKELQASALHNQPDLEIIAIGREETTDSLAAFKTQFNLNYTLVADPDKSIYLRYANQGIPRLLLLDEKNQVMQTWVAEEPNTINKVTW
ncbi:Redoxin domain protein [Pseudoalteromonas luteoviolacea B = ATCC 29581]|nr:Redoxin domain protein [Pseudoalteromonas luteoviolacea B = ATCC 29581]